MVVVLLGKEIEDQPGSVVLYDLKVLLERLVKLDRQDLLEVKAVLELVVKKVKREMSVVMAPMGL